MRTLILSKGLKARLADALIAQCCIDAGATLVCRDRDFRHFARWGGLKLAG
jgi:predicted nucleic acid-binding protein